MQNDSISPEERAEKNEVNRRYYANHRERLAEEKAQYRKDNPDKETAAKRRYYARNRGAVIERVRLYNKANPEKRKRSPDKNHERNLRIKYGLTVADYNAMFQKQEGRCWICLKHQSEITLRLYVDHDHETGAVRGLLCKPCNTVLGLASDKVEVLQRAISYLEKSRE